VTRRSRRRPIASRNALSPSGRPINSLRCSAAKAGSCASRVEKIGERGERSMSRCARTSPSSRPARCARSLEWGQIPIATDLPTSHARASSASARRLPDADLRLGAMARRETSRFPNQERAHMPGSPTVKRHPELDPLRHEELAPLSESTSPRFGRKGLSVVIKYPI